ncbi:MAG: hypothetical protein SFW64_01360 [Alphaproteobacteria bacterium]|nr:hypothetical protein [Alphaproteobacteria bacterium]
MKKTFVVMAFALLLSACEQGPSPYRAPPFAFEQTLAAPTRINVARITVHQNYHPPLKRPYVDQEFPVAPAQAVEKWVMQRLKAAGNSGVLEVTIEDASVKEVKLPKSKGLKGLITDDQDARYDARLVVHFRLYSGARGISDASGQVNVTRSRSINERATVYEREAIFHRMTAEMIADFERETQARLRGYFSAYLMP